MTDNQQQNQPNDAPHTTNIAKSSPVGIQASGNVSHATVTQIVSETVENQYIETHLYFGLGVQRTRRVESDTVAEVCPYPTDMAAFRPEDAEWFSAGTAYLPT